LRSRPQGAGLADRVSRRQDNGWRKLCNVRFAPIGACRPCAAGGRKRRQA
jgi:hypothetical protein